jgi:hypothetical protein
MTAVLPLTRPALIENHPPDIVRRFSLTAGHSKGNGFDSSRRGDLNMRACRCLARTSTRSSPSPLPIKDGAVLRTIRCVTTYMLAMPQEHAEGCQRWRRAAELLLEQADVAEVSRQVHLALFYDAQLDIGRWVEGCTS